MLSTLAIVCSLINGMDSPNWTTREKCTRQLIFLNNNYDIPKLVYKIGANHSSPEVRRRVGQVLAKYYYPYSKDVPCIRYMDGLQDEVWLRCYKKAFFESGRDDNYMGYGCCGEDENIPEELDITYTWISLGKYEEQIATNEYINNCYKNGHKRKEIVQLVNKMYDNENKKQSYMLPTRYETIKNIIYYQQPFQEFFQGFFIP